VLEDRRPITIDQLERGEREDCRATPGAEHDWRPREWNSCWNKSVTSLVCVWCDVIACGNYNQADPCMEPYHHRGDHLSRFGVRWPIGGTRPDVKLAGS
jgi:hypothetical protein